MTSPQTGPETSPAESATALQTVPGAARLNRLHADALLAIDLGEHDRRREGGTGAVVRLHLLDSLIRMPLDEPMPSWSLADRDLTRAVSTSSVIVEQTSEGLIRRLRPAVEVICVQVVVGSWWTRLRHAASFSRFVPAEIMLHRRPSPEQMLQADYFGVGLAGTGPLKGEQFKSASTPPSSFQAVDWLFRERAYETWITSVLD